MEKKLFIAITGCLMLCLLDGCVHELPFPAEATPVSDSAVSPASASCSADTVYFQNTVLPLLNSGCSMAGCHDAASHKMG
jgi:hypothetical protein